MATNISSAKPLSILVLDPHSDSHCPSLLSKLQRHYVLICRSISQALAAVPTFSPDLLILESGLAGRHDLAQGLIGLEETVDLTILEYDSIRRSLGPDSRWSDLPSSLAKRFGNEFSAD